MISQARHPIFQAHSELIALFRTDHGDGVAACRAARDLLADLSLPSPEDPSGWDSYRVLTSDVQTLLAYMREADVRSSAPSGFRNLLIKVLGYLYEADNAKLGELLAAEILDAWTNELGELHPSTIRITERLAACVHARSDYQKARTLFENALFANTEVHGVCDSATLMAAANLGACLNDLGDYQAALRHNEDAVIRCSLTLGRDDETTLLATENFAVSLHGLDQLELSLAVSQDVLKRRVRKDGPDHLATLHSAANVAVLHGRLNDHEAARAINADLLPRLEHLVGRNHSSTKSTRAQLVRNLQALGRDEEADRVGGFIRR